MQPEAIRFTGPQLIKLRDALVDAFPSYLDLQSMVDLGMDPLRLAAVAGEGPLNDVTFRLLMRLNAQWRNSELLAVALNANPTHPGLKELTNELKGNMIAPAQNSVELRPGQMERILHSASGFVEVVQWRQRMMDCEAAVCRIEMEDGVGEGTGFLVGSDLVLTNYHVFDSVWNAISQAPDVALRFDFKAAGNGVAVASGRTYRMAHDWNVDSSPASPTGICDPAHLDFLLLRVDWNSGEGDVATRPVLSLTPRDVEAGEPLLILQHPMAKPLKLAFGSVVEPGGAGAYMIHDVNTEPGSSGAPCFDSQWNVVALHYYGNLAGNRAIMAGPIHERIQARLHV